MHKPYNDSMSTTVVAASDCSESLLSGCVPLQLPLSKHVFIIPPIISNLLRPSIQLVCASDCSKDSSSDCTIVTIYTTYRKQWSPCELLKGIPWSIVQSKRKMAKDTYNLQLDCLPIQLHSTNFLSSYKPRENFRLPRHSTTLGSDDDELLSGICLIRKGRSRAMPKFHHPATPYPIKDKTCTCA
jgi:hypothetical protein